MQSTALNKLLEYWCPRFLLQVAGRSNNMPVEQSLLYDLPMSTFTKGIQKSMIFSVGFLFIRRGINLVYFSFFFPFAQIALDLRSSSKYYPPPLILFLAFKTICIKFSYSRLPGESNIFIHARSSTFYWSND